MNKSVLKRFATQMRLDLISLVSNKLDYLLDLGNNVPVALQNDVQNIKKITDRCSTNNEIDKTKKEEFVEEVAYTWFNRLVAFRFMDANKITEPSVISPLEGQTLPVIFNNAVGQKFPSGLELNTQKFNDIIDGKIPVNNPNNETYKMLFIASCNQYSTLMPFMFEAISDYTELLLPDDLISANSVRAKVVEAMSEEDCKNIEILGWLYQFYIAEKKDDVFAMLKKNKKITPSNIPAATQLFTPDWIVKYMVQNSLGKLWMLNNPDSKLKEHMKYYIENEEETQDFIKVKSPEELTLLDPCMGSGHILTYAFDLLALIYEEEGAKTKDIPKLILENNLYGCDIDKRAATLAQFALTMKARMYFRRFFKDSVRANVIELQTFESDEFKDIKNIGSLLSIKDKENFEEGVFGQNIPEYTLQEKILSSEYHCVVTNPPYMGSKGMNKELSDFVKRVYPDSKSDLFAVFMERTLELTKLHGFMAMINQHSWMFLSSYEKLRVKIIEQQKIDTMVHLGPRAFEEIGGEVVQSVAFVLEKAE